MDRLNAAYIGILKVLNQLHFPTGVLEWQRVVLWDQILGLIRSLDRVCERRRGHLLTCGTASGLIRMSFSVGFSTKSYHLDIWDHAKPMMRFHEVALHGRCSGSGVSGCALRAAFFMIWEK